MRLCVFIIWAFKCKGRSCFYCEGIWKTKKLLDKHKNNCILKYLPEATVITNEQKHYFESIVTRRMQERSRNKRKSMSVSLPFDLQFFKNLCPKADVTMIGPATTLKKQLDYKYLRDFFRYNNWCASRDGANGNFVRIDSSKKIELKYILRKSIKKGTQGISILESSVFAEVIFKAYLK